MMVEIKVFGKPNCQVCKNIHDKMLYFYNKWLSNGGGIVYCDMETEDGLAEGAFADVYEIPTVILMKNGKELGRWLKTSPTFEELKLLLAIGNEK